MSHLSRAHVCPYTTAKFGIVAAFALAALLFTTSAEASLWWFPSWGFGGTVHGTATSTTTSNINAVSGNHIVVGQHGGGKQSNQSSKVNAKSATKVRSGIGSHALNRFWGLF